MSDSPPIVQHAEDAHQAIRAICHDAPAAVPAPDLYRVLGNLKGAGGYSLADALTQLAAAFERSLSDYDVYEDDGTDPRPRIKSAARHMRAAAMQAEIIGEALETAQNTINGQGYRD